VGWDDNPSRSRHCDEPGDSSESQGSYHFWPRKIQLYIDIYNTRISHQYVVILLGMADIKVCFRFPRIHPDLTGAFGFMAGGFYNLATAMVLDLLPLRLIGSRFDEELRLYPWHMLIASIW